ncbi:YlbD family protein [Bacillus sp. 179-C3.3 HS]|uniref:YlbD family protein n=1 Tax=Bacillus sp. 179-C3.3 HS TaxID=3232162 RepID=UPI00399FCE6D
MTNKQKQTSIDEFKQFVRRHPKLIQEVHAQQKSWQHLYENWVMFGEEDDMWSSYRQTQPEKEKVVETKQREAGKADFMSKMVSAVKKMDAEQMNEQMNKMSQSISSLQSLLGQFSSNGSKKGSSGGSQHPFSFRKD